MASKSKVITIDITKESITIVEVTPSNKKQSTIHNAIIFETPEDAYEDGVIRDKERIAEAIKSQLSANGITNKNAIFVLTSTKIVNREVLVPFVKENKIKGIINANSSEYFPVNIEDTWCLTQFLRPLLMKRITSSSEFWQLQHQRTWLDRTTISQHLQDLR